MSTHVVPCRPMSAHVVPCQPMSSHGAAHVVAWGGCRPMSTHVDRCRSMSTDVDRCRSMSIDVVTSLNRHWPLAAHIGPCRQARLPLPRSHASTCLRRCAALRGALRHVDAHVGPHVDSCRPMSAHVDPCRSMSIDVDRCRSMSVHVDRCRLVSKGALAAVGPYGPHGPRLSPHVGQCWSGYVGPCRYKSMSSTTSSPPKTMSWTTCKGSVNIDDDIDNDIRRHR